MWMKFTLKEAQELVDFFGGEDAEVMVKYFEKGHSGDGIYAYFDEYPEEGSIKLSKEQHTPPIPPPFPQGERD